MIIIIFNNLRHGITITLIVLAFLALSSCSKTPKSHKYSEGDRYTYSEKLMKNDDFISRTLVVNFGDKVSNYYNKDCNRMQYLSSNSSGRTETIAIKLAYQDDEGNIYSCGLYDLNDYSYKLMTSSDAIEEGLRLLYKVDAEPGERINKYRAEDGNVCYRTMTGFEEVSLGAETFYTQVYKTDCKIGSSNYMVTSNYATSISAVVKEKTVITENDEIYTFELSLLEYELSQ